MGSVTIESVGYWREWDSYADDGHDAGPVLVWALGSAPTSHERGRVRLASYQDSGGWMDGAECVKRVTHWMPLPGMPPAPAGEGE